MYCDSETKSNHILKNERGLRHVLYKPTFRVPDDLTGDHYGCSPGKQFPDRSKERNTIFKDQVAFRNIKKYDPSDAASHHKRPLMVNYSVTKTSKKYTWRLFVVTMSNAC